MPQTSDRIQQLWQLLLTIDAFTYESRPGEQSKTDWHGHGEGRVIPEQQQDTIHFVEQGWFQLAHGARVDTVNRFIWQRSAHGMHLSHGRRGEPVYLFELLPQADGTWRSEQQHVCIEDHYWGTLRMTEAGFEFVWYIRGPKKEENLIYHYHS